MIFFRKKLKHYAFERYFYLNQYEYSVYLDNDIYIMDKAEPLPELNGIMCVKEPDNKSSNIFRKSNNLIPSYPYFNSGVIMCDNIHASKICDYMIFRVKNGILAKGKNTDNMMLNEYLIEKKNEINFQAINEKWNYMPFISKNIKKIYPNFYHFVGKAGKELISLYLELKKKEPKLNIEYFISNAEINLPLP